MEQSRRPGGGVTAFSGNRQAVDKQPGQRQRDGQQQPGPQPGGKKNPHANVLPRSDVPHHPHGVVGQAALHGLLAKVRDLGLELLEARRTGGTRSMWRGPVCCGMAGGAPVRLKIKTQVIQRRKVRARGSSPPWARISGSSAATASRC